MLLCLPDKDALTGDGDDLCQAQEETTTGGGGGGEGENSCRKLMMGLLGFEYL